MDEETGYSSDASPRARLWRARTPLLASVLSIGALGLAGGTGLVAILAAIAAVVAATAFLPVTRPSGQRHVAASRMSAGVLESLTVRDLADAVPDPIVVFDRGGTIISANAAALRAFTQLVPGASLQLRFRAPELHAMIDGVVSGDGGPDAVDYAERVPIERWFRVSAQAVGKDTGLFALVFEDQSEVRRIDRMRQDFIANASHELRTPLASITGFIETIRGPARNDPKAQEQFLQIMQSQTGRMARLIDDLLSLSRLETRPYLIPGAPFDIRRVLDTVSDSLRQIATDSGVSIEKAYGDGPALVRGSEDELTQVFENLLENACKYGQSGGRVILSIGPGEEGGVAVSVTDFGPGIPAEHIPRVTERFYRVDVETSRAQKGTGLGLAIVKHIVTRHRARLTIRSSVNEGSTFTVHFPPA